MVGTILPMVHGAKKRSRGLAILISHAFGYVLGSFVLGGALGLFSMVVEERGGSLFLWTSSAKGSDVAVVALAFASFAYGLRDLNILSFPLPTMGWQVPATWRHAQAHYASFRYGFILGLGFITQLQGSALVVPALWAILSGNPLSGGLAVLGFGLGRAAPLLWFGLPRLPREDCLQTVSRLDALWPVPRLVSGAALGATGFWMIGTLLVGRV